MSIKDLPSERQREILKGRLYSLKVKGEIPDVVKEIEPVYVPKDGKDGVDGIQGIPGPQGPAGIGIQGPEGPQGPAGVDGKDGKDSTVPGPQGPQGEPGQDGKDGKDGITPTVEFATGKDADRLKINGKVQGPHLTGPQGPGMSFGAFTGGGGASGTTDHAELTNLDWENSGHTGDLDLGDNKLTTKDFRKVGNVVMTYSGDWIDTIIKNGRTITYTNDGDKYTQWEDNEYAWIPSYSSGIITGITVNAK